MQCVILAGGQGTRLKEFLGDLPKPMIAIGDRPLIEHQILLANKHGFSDILILTGHGARQIEEFLGDGSRFGVNIECQIDSHPLGTAGALLNAFHRLQDLFFVMYGDVMLNVDFGRMWSAHPSEADASLFLHPNSHPFDSDLVDVDPQGWVVGVHPYPHPEGRYFRNLVNAALYVCSKRALQRFHRMRDDVKYPLDMGKHLFPALLEQGRRLFGYISREYVHDAGTPKRVLQVRRDYEIGRIANSSLDVAMPAIFLDRDGTLNYEREWLSDPEELELMPRVAEAVRRINESGYLAVVITNQPVIARGECSEQGLRVIHDKLEWLLGQEHAYVDGIYYCPHHPDSGFPGERAELKRVCSCRKPATGLFEQATRDLNIDLSRSWMMGDRAADVDAAKALGIRSVLIGSGNHLKMRADARADYETDQLFDAVQFALASATKSEAGAALP